MKRVFLVMWLIALSNMAYANVVINEFAVDLQQDWDNSGGITTSDEWVELYNNGNSEIDLTGWKLALLDSTNENENLSGKIGADSYFIISNPAGQQNNDGMLILYDKNSGLIDEVAYGNYNDTNPADNAPDGNANGLQDECLSRMPNGADTNVDSTDFVKQKCTRSYSNDLVNLQKGNSANLEINAFVEGSKPTVDYITIGPDDDNLTEGIQVIPAPGSNKTVAITASVTDNSGYSNIQSVITEISIGATVVKTKELSFVSSKNMTSADYSGSFGMAFYDSPGDYEVKVTVSNGDVSGSNTALFQYLTLIGLEIDAQTLTFSNLAQGETAYVYGDSDLLTKDRPTVRNIGNSAINTEIYGADLEYGNNSISMNNLKYRFGNESFSQVSAIPGIAEINLGSNERINFDLGLYVPVSTISGMYTGSLVITALS